MSGGFASGGWQPTPAAPADRQMSDSPSLFGGSAGAGTTMLCVA
jgi:hypothetical protein